MTLGTAGIIIHMKHGRNLVTWGGEEVATEIGDYILDFSGVCVHTGRLVRERESEGEREKEGG